MQQLGFWRDGSCRQVESALGRKVTLGFDGMVTDRTAHWVRIDVIPMPVV
jgi:hypothetical protein